MKYLFILSALLILTGCIGADIGKGALVSSQEQAKDVMRINDIKTTAIAVDIYEIENEAYPKDLSQLTDFIVPIDPQNGEISPLGCTYGYTYTQENGGYKLTACMTNTKYSKDDNGKDINLYELASSKTNNLPTNNETDMAELTGNVVIDINHALAGKTLTFDVEMMKITKGGSGTTDNVVESGDSIEVHYTGTLEDGEKFDSSKDRGETLPFTVGAGQMIPGFDAGVVGMKLGESKILTLEPKDAYGEYDESKTQTIPKKDLASFVAAGIELKVGAKLPTQFGEFTIIEVTE